MNINPLNSTHSHHAPLEFALNNSTEDVIPKKINYNKVMVKIILIAELLCPENDENNLQLAGAASLSVLATKNVRYTYDFDFTAKKLEKVKNVMEKIKSDSSSFFSSAKETIEKEDGKFKNFFLNELENQNFIFKIDLTDARIAKGSISLGKTTKRKDGIFIQFSVTQRKDISKSLFDNNDLLKSHLELNNFLLDKKLFLEDGLSDIKNSDQNNLDTLFDEDKDSQNSNESLSFKELIKKYEEYEESKDTIDFSSHSFEDIVTSSYEDVKITGTDALTIINPLVCADVKAGLFRRDAKFKHDTEDFKIAIHLLKDLNKLDPKEFCGLYERFKLRNKLFTRLNLIEDSLLRKEIENKLCTSQATVNV